MLFLIEMSNKNLVPSSFSTLLNLMEKHFKTQILNHLKHATDDHIKIQKAIIISLQRLACDEKNLEARI